MNAQTAWSESGADGFGEYRRLIFDAGIKDAARLETIEKILRAAAEENPALWRARHGRVLAVLGRGEDARAALSGAAKDPAAARWLGALSLAEGDAERALTELSRAAKSDSWSRALRGAALAALGRPADAELAAAARAGGEAARFAALVSGLAQARAGRPEAARRALDAEAAADPKSAWAPLLRARLCAAAGDVAARLRDLDEALRREPSAWVRDERSRAYEELGDMDRALAECDRAIEAAPDADRYLRRAFVQTCRRHYHLAGPDYLEAARLSPARVEAWLGAASIELTRGRPGEAADLAARAAAQSPDDDWARLEAQRYAILAGRGAAAEKALGALERSRPDLAASTRFLRGLAALKAKRAAAAAKLFADAAAKAGGNEELAGKAKFYRVIALALSQPGHGPRRARSGEKRLLITGLGGSPPYASTLGALRSAAASDFAFNNLSEPEIAPLIGLLAAEVEPTMFDVRGADRRWTKTIFDRIEPGRTVSFITRGHPQVCGGLAGSLIQECGQTSTSWDLLPAVSSMDTLGLRLERGRALWGQQVIDWSTVYDDRFRVEVRLPLVLYFNAAAQVVTAQEYARFCDKLAAVYGEDGEFWFFGRTFTTDPETVTLKDVRGWHGRIDPSYTLVAPARPE